MITKHRQQQGYALLVMLIGLMGFGGLLASGFTQDAKTEIDQARFDHNQRVLKEAKQALLMYAFNFPTTNDRGPGRLPCPDDDNDGDAESDLFCTDGVPIVGRLPWRDNRLGFYDARDADGERLWYAVSNNFAWTGPPIVNSDSIGRITIIDQSGQLRFDGTSDGVAAIIIAPGAPSPVTITMTEFMNTFKEGTQLHVVIIQ